MSTLPLGIDIGRERLRIALVERDARGEPRLSAVAVRTVDDGDLADAIVDAVAELDTRERRCVFALSDPDALLRRMTFPTMSRRDTVRAARFEARRFIDYPASDALVRIAENDESSGSTIVTIVNRPRLNDLTHLAKRARLHPVAVDHRAFAIARGLDGADAIIDIGVHRSTLFVYGRELPSVYSFPIGGAMMTSAIADAFGIERDQAERRKRAHGFAGAGENLCSTFVDTLNATLIDLRATGSIDITDIVLCGNGARLSDLAGTLERATAVPMRLAELRADVSDTLPPDVLRAAGPDWATAYGLALWETAG